LILLFDLITVNRETDCGITDIITDLNKRFELDVKDYEIAILAAIAIDGNSADSAETDFEINAVKILVIFVFIRNVDICQIS
jgi:hypothetical protein